MASGARGSRERWSAARAGRGQVRPCPERTDEERIRYARRTGQSPDKEALEHEETRQLPKKSQARSSFKGTFYVRI